MSIKITIEDYPQRNFFREIIVQREADDPRIKRGIIHANDCREIHTYRATISSGSRGAEYALFEHRYGDPLTVLLAEATGALGDTRVERRQPENGGPNE